MLAEIIHTKLQNAKATADDDCLFVLPTNIWLCRNELDGFTLMKPSDY